MKSAPCLLCCFFLSAILLFSQSAQNEIVYVTNTGKAYHRENCTSLRSSKIAVPLTDAVKTHNACSICNPPVINAESIPMDNAELYRVNVAGVKNSGAADISRMLTAEVVGHVDGDTVRVRINNPPKGLSVVETIRLLGVDTPETVHPNQPVQYFGKEASDYTHNRLLGRTVYLAFDWDLRDRYSRLLAYIYTGPGNCFNADLIREGYGFAYLRYSFQFMKEFEGLGHEAKQQKRGLWAANSTTQ